MDQVSRRQFLRNASLGAAATGVLAAYGTDLVRGAGSNAAHPLASPGEGPSAATLDGSDVFAHVVDARTGQMSLFIGTKEISYTNRDLAQQILRAAQ
jgi:hypothetical protein